MVVLRRTRRDLSIPHKTIFEKRKLFFQNLSPPAKNDGHDFAAQEHAPLGGISELMNFHDEKAMTTRKWPKHRNRPGSLMQQG